MEHPNSVSGQIAELFERGYTNDQIWRELRSRPNGGKPSRDRVSEVVSQIKARTLDSRRLADVYELCVEILAIVRADRKHDVKPAIRAVEKRLAGVKQSG